MKNRYRRFMTPAMAQQARCRVLIRQQTIDRERGYLYPIPLECNRTLSGLGEGIDFSSRQYWYGIGVGALTALGLGYILWGR